MRLDDGGIKLGSLIRGANNNKHSMGDVVGLYIQDAVTGTDELHEPADEFPQRF